MTRKWHRWLLFAIFIACAASYVIVAVFLVASGSQEMPHSDIDTHKYHHIVPSLGSLETPTRNDNTLSRARGRTSGTDASFTASFVAPSVNQTLLNLIQPRIFYRWNDSLSFPCFEPDDKIWTTATQRRAPGKEGFFFVKLIKVGGSTAAGVHLRISRRQIESFRHNQLISAGTKNAPKPFCMGRWDHAPASALGYRERDRSRSFLWSMVRDPTKRALSQFFHFQVSRKNNTPSSLPSHLGRSSEYMHHYLRYLSMSKVTPRLKDERGPVVVQNILSAYDFVGVTERFSESILVLTMLLNLTFADVVYLDAKRHGHFDAKCTYLQPTVVTPSMNNFFQSPAWQKKVKWDAILYHAVNKSLDLTIDSLGRVEFEKKLTDFEALLRKGHEICSTQNVFPCDDKGKPNTNTSCLWIDSGCGNDCLDTLFRRVSV